MPKRPRLRPSHSLETLQPLRIAKQIATLQSIFYASATVLILFSSLVSGQKFSLDLILGWETVRSDVALGWVIGGCWIGVDCVLIVAITLLIARSKLVLDFTFTLFLLHLLFTTLYSHSIPRSLSWWCLWFFSVILTCVASGYFCRQRELRPIDFGGSSGGIGGGTRGITDGLSNNGEGSSGATTGPSPITRPAPDGRGGTYEMVVMKGEDQV